jgi:C-3',4' desaturase CrtD
MNIVVIGAGIGGLTCAALLRRAGHAVTVLEAQTYPGGCAGTFFWQGYRFDTGATLAGGFSEGGPHWQVAQQLGLTWPVEPVRPIAWITHLPDGPAVRQWVDAAQWEAEWRSAFPGSAPFWRRQARLADLAWDVTTRPFPWPPERSADLLTLARAIRPRTLGATPWLLRTMRHLLPPDDPALRLFVDANLLISAQTTADHANALYGSAALDLPRRGVSHVTGGIGALAETLVQWLRDHGGEVLFRQQVDQIVLRGGRAVAVQTNTAAERRRKGVEIPCDALIANLTPWGLARLLGEAAPSRLGRELRTRPVTWGAFMLYVGAEAAALPALEADHHQVIGDAALPLGEGNSVFVSMSPPGDTSRAPAGMRAINLSTHTDIGRWWALRDAPGGKAAYEALRAAYTERMLASAEKAIPGLRQAARVILPATPVTYAHWTGRPLGMVGGFAQTSLLDARGPGTGIPNVWLVGDSIFPGQSTAGVTAGALRVAQVVLSRKPTCSANSAA